MKIIELSLQPPDDAIRWLGDNFEEIAQWERDWCGYSPNCVLLSEVNGMIYVRNPTPGPYVAFKYDWLVRFRDIKMIVPFTTLEFDRRFAFV